MSYRKASTHGVETHQVADDLIVFCCRFVKPTLTTSCLKNLQSPMISPVFNRRSPLLFQSLHNHPGPHHCLSAHSMRRPVALSESQRILKSFESLMFAHLKDITDPLLCPL